MLLSSCLKFGENIELKGNEITANIVKKIESVTSIPLPTGTTHLVYSYFGDTIDPYWLYKGKLTREGYLAIKENDIFQKAQEGSKQNIYQDSSPKWWHPENLTYSINKKKEFSDGSLLTLSIGEEESQYIIYISYHTI